MENELQDNLDQILLDKETNLLPENLKEGVTVLGVEGSLKVTGSDSNIKLFETVEDMNNDPNPKEDDLAVVYREEYQNMDVDTQTQYITFPETVVLPEAITSDYRCTYKYIDNTYGSFSVRLNDNSFRFSSRGTPIINITYTSVDGITYNRDVFSIDNLELTNPVDLDSIIHINVNTQWNDNFGYFMQIGGTTFDGLYKYIGTDNYNNYGLANTQFTLTSPNQLLPGISAYGKNGNVTGDGSICTPNNTFADIPAQLYYNIKKQYDVMTPKILTDDNKTIDKNIYFIPVKSDGTILLDTSKVSDLSYIFTDCKNLTEIPLINTSNATDMRSMFSGCENLTTVPLIDTSNAIKMTYMFSGCQNLTEIPKLNTKKATDTHGMFNYCKNLISVPQLNLSNTVSVFDMFSGCQNITTVPVFNLSNINTPLRMFDGCPNLSDESLNNILASCITATNITNISYKTLQYTGLTGDQANICMNLSNYQNFINAGWTTGY